MAHFTVEDVTFTYPEAAAPALRNVDVRIKHGSYTLVCGRSGCGKTTLLRHFKSVLAPEGSMSGRILFNDTPLVDVSERDQSAMIGFVMQNPDAQIVTDKVWHELAFGLESLGTDQRTMRLRVAEMASYFGIQTWFHKDVRELSGGQKQLLNLASIMAMQPSALILDEPTSQLDPIAAADFLNTVRKINLELGTTIIITEHRLEDVFASADQVVVMDAGRVVADGAPLDVVDQLYACESPMTYALPAPVRIYEGVKGVLGGILRNDVNDAAGNASCDVVVGDAVDATVGDAVDATARGVVDDGVPLTVREGRTWLTNLLLAYPPTHTHLPEETLAVLDIANPVLRVRELWMRYEREAPDVLRGVDVAIPEAVTFALVGGNGTGKSTLLKSMCGVVKPYRGNIDVFGKPLRKWKSEELFDGTLAMLPQDPQNLFVKKTVREDLAEMLRRKSLSAKEKEARVAEVAHLCDIEALLDSHPFDLSGGEQQRAALAKVLLCEPRILLLDEPTKGIDNFFKRELALIFERLKARGTTIVMVSHDVEFCARYADVVAMFFDGAVITANTPRRFFSQNSFYTTAANRMSRNVFANAITDEDVIELARKGVQ